MNRFELCNAVGQDGEATIVGPARLTIYKCDRFNIDQVVNDLRREYRNEFDFIRVFENGEYLETHEVYTP